MVVMRVNVHGGDHGHPFIYMNERVWHIIHSSIIYLYVLGYIYLLYVKLRLADHLYICAFHHSHFSLLGYHFCECLLICSILCHQLIECLICNSLTFYTSFCFRE